MDFQFYRIVGESLDHPGQYLKYHLHDLERKKEKRKKLNPIITRSLERRVALCISDRICLSFAIKARNTNAGSLADYRSTQLDWQAAPIPHQEVLLLR